jgi:hypothetical protein
LHCAIDRDSGNTLSLIHPRIRIQFLGRSITRVVQFLFARFRSFLLIVVAMWCGGHEDKHENSEKEKEQNNTKPRPERNRWARCRWR